MKTNKTQKATFAAGCFWHIEEVFDEISGVISTRVGYVGGKTPAPTYKNVCSGDTGHVEAVEVIFNPSKISYEKLLEVFWNIHDPTEKDRQGLDVGSQYNSVIFYHNETQKKAAMKSKKEKQNKAMKNIVTQIKRVSRFWEAENYHQKYYKKHGFLKL